MTVLKYIKTAKGRATHRKASLRYRQTAKGREKQRQYKQTERYKEYSRRYTANYRLREDKQDIFRRYQQSPKRKAYNAEYWKKEENALRMKKHQHKYNLSEKGKEKSERHRRSSKRLAWLETPKAKVLRSRINFKRRAGEKAAGGYRYLTSTEWEAIKANQAKAKSKGRNIARKIKSLIAWRPSSLAPEQLPRQVPARRR
jgi:hypothetical protein